MKDKKPNINVGYEKLSKEEITSHKNFGKVYQSYTALGVKPMQVAKKYPFTKMIVVATVTVTAVAVGVWKYKSTTQQTAKKQTASQTAHPNTGTKSTITQKKPFIHPPIKGANVPYSSYKVESSKGGIYTYNKSKITIPANAFCDENGKDVNGTVQINYREFHDAIDFFVSGIPMTYDSAGSTYNFESAGMLDMQGTLNGKPVYIKPGKTIQVAMSSVQTGTKYNVYKLDTAKKNWTYVEKSKYQLQQSKTTTVKKDIIINIQQLKKQDSLSTAKNIAAIKQEEKKLEAEKPVPPVKAKDNNYTFSIDADKKDFPELSVYENLMFEVDPSDKEYDPNWVKSVWTDAKLTRGKNSNDYIFTVSKGDIKHDIFIHPVFQGKDYEVATKEYNQKFSDYQVKLEAKKEEEKKEKEAYWAKVAEMEKKQEQAMNERLATIQKEKEADAKNKADAQASMQKQYQKTMVQNNVINYLTLNNFGVWNCDNPNSLPEGASLTPFYTDVLKEDLNGTNIYLIRKDKNSIITFYPGHKCSFDPSERNLAWAVTPDGKLAIYTEDDFSQITKKSGDFTFVMKVLDNDITDYASVKEALKPYM